MLKKVQKKNSKSYNITKYTNKDFVMASSSNKHVETADEGKLFTLKKWNVVAMWSWDVECDTCAICRVQVMDACLRCQAESKADSRHSSAAKDCVVVWGECNHSFHQCCMSLWIKQSNR